MIEVKQGDALTKLRELPSESVQCVVTSPPYWGLRDYGTGEWEGGEEGCDHKVWRDGAGRADGVVDDRSQRSRDGAGSIGGDCGKCGAKRIDSQLGLERTPEEYVAKMVELFREVRRVLRRDGTLWLNLGDSYATQPAGNFGKDMPKPADGGAYRENKPKMDWNGTGLKPKDLCGIPWRVAFALQADGWWLRSDIIWAKPNPMPESVTDRPTKSHEYLFLLTRSANYFYDAEAIKEPLGCSDEEYEKMLASKRRQNSSQIGTAIEVGAGSKRDGFNSFISDGKTSTYVPSGRNKRSVWTIATAPYPEAHFATYPPDLVKPCILAGTSAKGCCAGCGAPWERVVEKSEVPESRNVRVGGYSDKENSTAWTMPSRAGERESKTLGWQLSRHGDPSACKCDAGVEPCTVLDPFAGSGTTGMVALELGRKAILIELNEKYVKLIRERCDITPGLALA